MIVEPTLRVDACSKSKGTLMGIGTLEPRDPLSLLEAVALSQVF